MCCYPVAGSKEDGKDSNMNTNTLYSRNGDGENPLVMALSQSLIIKVSTFKYFTFFLAVNRVSKTGPNSMCLS